MMIFRVISIKLCTSSPPKTPTHKVRISSHLPISSSSRFTSRTPSMLWDHSFTTAAGSSPKILTILRVINTLGINNNNNKSRCSNSCKIRIIQTNTRVVNSKFMSRSNSLRWSTSLSCQSKRMALAYQTLEDNLRIMRDQIKAFLNEGSDKSYPNNSNEIKIRIV